MALPILVVKSAVAKANCMAGSSLVSSRNCFLNRSNSSKGSKSNSSILLFRRSIWLAASAKTSPILSDNKNSRNSSKFSLPSSRAQPRVDAIFSRSLIVKPNLRKFISRASKVCWNVAYSTSPVSSCIIFIVPAKLSWKALIAPVIDLPLIC